MIICAASNNAGKLKELRRILERMGHEVKSLRELGIEGEYEGIGNCVLGYPADGWPEAKPRKEHYVYYVK